MILSQQRMALMLIGCWERGGEEFVGLMTFFPSLMNLVLDQNSYRGLLAFTEGFNDMPEALPGIMERDKDKVVD